MTDIPLQPHEPLTRISVTVPQTLQKRLKALCLARHTPMSELLCSLLEEHVNALEADAARTGGHTIHLDERCGIVSYSGHSVELTQQQTLVLSVLARHSGVVPYEELTRSIDPGFHLASPRRQVANCIYQIRRVLEQADIPLSVLTVHYHGYYLRPNVELSTQTH